VIWAVLEWTGLKVAGVERIGAREIIVAWTALASVLIATFVMVRLIEKIPWSALALDRAAASPGQLIKGAALGGLTIGVASLALLGIHQLQIERSIPGSWWGAAERSTATLLPAAFFEELFFRGYAFSVLRRAMGWKTALVVTSVAFGFVHSWNPGADAEAILAVVVAGFFLGGILLATRSLYAAGAAHFAWNWVMAVALHIEVSGLSSPYPDYRTIETGPDWLTGGRWGPEGGLAAVAAMFIVFFYLYGRYLRRMESKA
jgi:membrane protease YdiL (CAAX protease family)